MRINDENVVRHLRGKNEKALHDEVFYVEIK